jgi:phosphoribosylamine--glycine ligase
MKVLIVGQGGREHALAYRLAGSPQAPTLYATRPNAGLASLAAPVDRAPEDIDGLVAFAGKEGIDLTVVGPELPLTLGLVDRFQAAGLRAFGPSRAAAQLEGSKAYAKTLMLEAGVPTATHGVFRDVASALAWARRLGRPVVVKADGLAAGKGVVLAATLAETEAALREMLEGHRFGAAGAHVVVEELLVGEEVSFIALCDGEHALPLASSQDHKRVGDGDTGPNTGGMGAYSPVPLLDEARTGQVMREVIEPTLRAMRQRGTPFVGFLYAGLMWTAEGPRVLEFNVRLGDPEAQPLMLRLESDLVTALEGALDGRLHQVELRWQQASALTVVMAAQGYPETPRKGDPITGLAEAAGVPGVVVFQAGTRQDGELVRTDGGRVLGVSALGADLREARSRAYQAAGLITWPGCHYRKDIGWRALG